MTRIRKRRRCGFALLDALIAVGLIGAAAFTIAVAHGRVARLDALLADRRAAVRLAETCLADDARGPADGLTVAALPTAAPPGWKWVRVTADVRGRRAELVGLVRSTS